MDYNSIMAQKDLLLLDFYADWCGPCKVMGKLLDGLENDLSGKVSILKCNIEDEDVCELVEKFKIRSVPTLLFVRDGEILEKIVGNVGKEKVMEVMNKFISL